MGIGIKSSRIGGVGALVAASRKRSRSNLGFVAARAVAKARAQLFRWSRSEAENVGIAAMVDAMNVKSFLVMVVED
tara:strand:- start:100 stop:327 length:228 start_codon:yes stop_codon:yes gene_type:complete